MGKVGERGEVTRWERWGEEVRWQGGRFLVLFKGRGHKMGPRFRLFVSDLNHQKEGAGWVEDFLVWPQGWENSP